VLGNYLPWENKMARAECRVFIWKRIILQVSYQLEREPGIRRPRRKMQSWAAGKWKTGNGKRDPDTDTWKTNLCGPTAKANTNRGTNTGVEVESTITMFPPQAYALVSGIFSGVAAHKRCILTQTNQTNS